jgi:hypothetical protein
MRAISSCGTGFSEGASPLSPRLAKLAARLLLANLHCASAPPAI